MKRFKRLVALVATISLISSCGILQGVTADANTTGNSTGSALASIYNILKSTGAIDLSNITTLINLGKILTGAGALSNANSAFAEQFASGLIAGSANLVNESNVNQVMNSLKALSSIDTSALAAAASAAADGKATTVNNSTAGAASTVATLNGIMKTFK